MPSGSHGGSSGSHSGGGSSSSSHSSFGSHSSSSRYSSSSSRSSNSSNRHYTSYSYGPRGPMRPMGPGGMHVHIFTRSGPMSKIAAIIILSLFLLVFSGVFFFLIPNSQKSYLNKIETDFTYYQQMISYAESHPNYIVTGKITDKFYNQDCGKWYLTYEFSNAEETITVEGYTFSVYTNDEIMEFTINDSVQLAINEYPITNQTDSITLDFKNKKLTDDGEYISTQNSIKAGFIMGGIIDAVLALFIVLTIVSYVKHRDDVLEETQPGFNDLENKTEKTAQNSQETETQTKRQEYKRCSYCGSIVDEKSNKCPNCGSKN